MTKKAFALFASSLFTGLFFVFSLEYGIDLSDPSGTLVTQLIEALFPQAGPYLWAIGLALAFVSFLGLVSLVMTEWDDNWQRGMAAGSGLLAGALTLVNVDVSIPFWVVGIIVSAL